jgi:hypothetical protein
VRYKGLTISDVCLAISINCISHFFYHEIDVADGPVFSEYDPPRCATKLKVPPGDDDCKHADDEYPDRLTMPDSPISSIG